MIEYVEWHDGKLKQLIIHLDGSIELVFKHMSSYHQLENDKTEVWSSKAHLKLAGVSKLVIDGQMEAQDYVGDGALLDSNGEEVPLLPVGEEKKIATAWMLLAGSGTRIDITATSATLNSLEPVRYLNDGPG